MKTLTLVKTNFNHHVSMDLYYEFEKAILGRPHWETIKGVNRSQAFILRQLLKLIPSIPIPFVKHKNYVVVGYQKEKLFPYFHFKADLKVLWMYDAWEPLFTDIENTIKTYRINILFTASKQSAEHFDNLQIPGFKCYWVPEGIDASQYLFVPYHERKIDILQLGRKWDFLHENILPLEKSFVYKYEKKSGQIIFPTRNDFLTGLANSKISICVPSNITHPNRTGNISTITNRYLQSMASKCLIVGKAPLDMPYLFDYNPIVEIDEKNSLEQIQSVLTNFDDYIPLIEKNYEVLIKNHQWINRVELMENYIQNH